jgi:hypothetical protein
MGGDAAGTCDDQKKADGPTETVGAPVRPTEEGRPQKTMACPTL